MSHAGFLISAALAVVVPSGLPVAAQCLLCTPSGKVPPGQAKKALTIEISTALDFSRAVLARSGQGSIRIDPNGARSVSSDLTALGGVALAGTVVIRGDPGRQITVVLPRQLNLSGSGGGTATVANIVTDLPDVPRLGASGELRSRFGGTFTVANGFTGTFRGRIPITADYL